MNYEAENFLTNVGVDEINPYAMYILVTAESGILLEDIAPLLLNLESTYRRVFALSKDNNVRNILNDRIKNKSNLSGIGRSINSKYNKMVVDKKREYNDVFTDNYKKLAHQELSIGSKDHISGNEIKLYEDQMYKKTINNLKYYYSHGEYPHRIEVSRSKFSSPGFLEIFGDPNTLTQLIVLFGLWINERRQNQQYQQNNIISSRQNQRDNINLLVEMGYSREEIESIVDYLDKDISTVIKSLNTARLQIAPGDRIDPL